MRVYIDTCDVFHANLGHASIVHANFVHYSPHLPRSWPVGVWGQPLSPTRVPVNWASYSVTLYLVCLLGLVQGERYFFFKFALDSNLYLIFYLTFPLAEIYNRRTIDFFFIYILRQA